MTTKTKTYTLPELNKIARKIWWGKFPKLANQKTAYAPLLGVKMHYSIFPVKTYRWQALDDFDIFIESQVRGDFHGTISVRRKI